MSDDAGDGDGAYDEVPDAAPLATPPAEPEPEGTGTISGGAAVIMSALSDLHDGRGSLPDAEYEAMRAEMEEAGLCDAHGNFDIESVKEALRSAERNEGVPEGVDEEIYFGMFHAAEDGDAAKLAELLGTGLDVNARSADDEGTVLHTAALEGHLDCALLLLARGGDATARDEDYSTPLHDASAGGYTAIVAALLEQGAAAVVSAQDDDGDTPLHLCCNADAEGCARLLLAAGADVALKNKKGKTPQMLGSAAFKALRLFEKPPPPPPPPLDVVLRAIGSKPQLNGLIASLVDWDGARGRYHVRVATKAEGADEGAAAEGGVEGEAEVASMWVLPDKVILPPGAEICVLGDECIVGVIAPAEAADGAAAAAAAAAGGAAGGGDAAVNFVSLKGQQARRAHKHSELLLLAYAPSSDAEGFAVPKAAPKVVTEAAATEAEAKS